MKPNADSWQQGSIRAVNSGHQGLCAASSQQHSDPAQRWRAEAIQEVSPSVEQVIQDSKTIRVDSLISQEEKKAAK